jgi:hypothetical protein
MSFESDSTRFVFEAVGDMKFPFIPRLTNIVKDFKLAVRSQKELNVLVSKYCLAECSVHNWEEDGQSWIECLEVIYLYTQNIRERDYALRVLINVDWKVDSEEVALIIEDVVHWKSDSQHRNPVDIWTDNMLTIKGVPSAKVLYKYYKLLVLDKIGLPKELAKLIVEKY